MKSVKTKTKQKMLELEKKANNKKVIYTIAIIAILLILTIFISLGINKDHIKISDKELRILSNQEGLEIRTLDLNRKIDMQLEKADIIIKELETTKSYANIDELKSITKKMYLAKKELDDSYQGSSSTIKYIIILEEVVKLNNEFKNIVEINVGEEEKENIKALSNEKTSWIKDQRFQNYEIRKNSYNSKKIIEIFTNYEKEEIGISLAQRYESGMVSSRAVANTLSNNVDLNIAKSQKTQTDKTAKKKTKKIRKELSKDYISQKDEIKNKISAQLNNIDYLEVEEHLNKFKYDLANQATVTLQKIQEQIMQMVLDPNLPIEEPDPSKTITVDEIINLIESGVEMGQYSR